MTFILTKSSTMSKYTFNQSVSKCTKAYYRKTIFDFHGEEYHQNIVDANEDPVNRSVGRSVEQVGS